MSLQFSTDDYGTLVIPGLHSDFRIGQWDEQRQLLSVFGLTGAVDLPGGFTTRTITIPIWIYNLWTEVGPLYTKLNQIENYVGAVGTLAETSGPLLRTYGFCRMEPSLPQSEPIPPNPHIGWSFQLELNFRQLRPG